MSRDDIVQAGSGGPDFTPKDWTPAPERPDVELRDDGYIVPFREPGCPIGYCTAAEECPHQPLSRADAPTPAPERPDPAMIAILAVKPCRDWRLWWHLGYTPICRVVGWLPISEWRREAWITRVDFAAMDLHKRLHR